MNATREKLDVRDLLIGILIVAALAAACVLAAPCNRSPAPCMQAPADIVVPHPDIEKAGHAMDHYMVVFSAKWCGPCQAMKPDVKALGREGMLVYTIDVDQEREAAEKMGVKSLPTIVVMAGGKEQARVVGRQTRDQLRELFESNSGGEKPADDVDPLDDDPGIDLPKKPLDYKVF